LVGAKTNYTMTNSQESIFWWKTDIYSPSPPLGY
jgi:hypothetical protein